MQTKGISFAIIVLMVISLNVTAGAQQPPAPARDTLPDGPQVFDSSSRGSSGS